MKLLQKKSSPSVLLLVALIVTLPFIVRVLPVNPLSYDVTFYNRDNAGDVFDLGKMWFLVSISAIILFSMLSEKLVSRNKHFIPRYAAICVAVITIATILSWFFSPMRDLGLRGALDHHETIFVLLSYIVLFVASAFFIKRSDGLWLVKGAFVISAALMTCVGLLQTFNINPYSNEVIQMLITWPSVGNGLTFKHEGVFGTIGNPNFYGSFCALTLPFLWFFACRQRKMIFRFVAIILAAAMVLSLAGSSSRAAFVALLLTMPFAGYWLGAASKETARIHILLSVVSISELLIYYVTIGVERSRVDPMLLIGTFALSIFAALLHKVISNVANRVGSKGLIAAMLILIVLLGSAVYQILPRADVGFWPLGKLERLTENSFKLMLYGETVIMKYQNGQLTLTDSKGSSIVDTSKEGKLELKLSTGKTVKANYSSDKRDPRLKGLVLYDPYIIFILAKTENSSHIFVSDVRFEQIEPVNAPYFKPMKGLEALGSGRFYIWSRTLPLLKDRILIGSGPDTFTPSFPQNDYSGKSSIHSNVYLIVDKPHNWYLQTAVHTGVASMLAVICLIVLTLYSLLKQLSKVDLTEQDSLDGALMASAIISYVVVSVFNDSVIAVAPLFWIVLGLSVSFADAGVHDSKPKRRG